MCIQSALNSILKQIEIDPNSYRKIILCFIDIIMKYCTDIKKFGGKQKIALFDETVLNFKNLSHRERSLENKTICLCIPGHVTFITRVFYT